MHALAQLISNKFAAWTLILAVLVVSGVGGYLAMRVEQDDNLLAFLPQANQEVATFNELAEQFGSLDVAMIGVPTEDPFDADFLTRLTAATNEIKETRGLKYALSLTNVVDFTADEVNGGVVTAALVREIPRTPGEKAELRTKVMSRDHVVGNLISRDGKAVMIYGFLAQGADPRATTTQLQAVAARHFPDRELQWGGNPFISSYIYDTAQNDLRRLTPWAVLVITLLMLVALRDVVGTLLGLLSTALAIGCGVGVMQVFGVKLNVMLGSVPIVLFAIGSSYAIHMLSRFYDLLQRHDGSEAVARTLTGTGPVVLIAGVTSAAAIMSFLAMDILPIRQYGLFTGIGILITMVFALTFIPAALRLCNFKRRPLAKPSAARRWMVRLAVFCQSRRLPVGATLVVTLLVFGLLVFRVQTGVDQSTFFHEGSPPARADRFLRDHFGAAQFVQVLVKGDMTEPAVLAEVQALSDRFETVPHVSGVQQVAQLVAILNDAMTGERRIPDTRAQVGNLYPFTLGDPSAGQLVTEDRKQALLQVKVDTSEAREVAKVLADIERLVAEAGLSRFEAVEVGAGPRDAEARARREGHLVARLARLTAEAGLALPADAARRVSDFLAVAGPGVDTAAVARALERFLRSGESAIELPAAKDGADTARELAQAVIALGPQPAEEPLRAAVVKALAVPADDPAVDDLLLSLESGGQDAWRRVGAGQRADHLLQALALAPSPGPAAERLRSRTAMALLDLERPGVLLPLAGAQAEGPGLDIQVSGLPVLHRGLARSVEHNQIRSLLVAVSLVFVLLALMFRSLTAGLLAIVPTLFTLVIIHGVMGGWRIQLDLGTSLLGSLILANGVDFAVHLMATWQAGESGRLSRAAATAADRTGPAIWTTALAMFVGFFVLTLGDAKPLQNVTALKATAMMVGAAASFLLVPVLARRRRYALLNEPAEADEESEAVESALQES
jgi:uncharacterized protein